jgi:hypothetical protein
MNTVQRNWHDLKPGDLVRFATDWCEVVDAYPVNENTVKVKIKVDGHIETYNVRASASSRAVCRA